MYVNCRLEAENSTLKLDLKKLYNVSRDKGHIREKL